MTFSDFSNYLSKLESISSRLEMTEILADLIKKLDSEEIASAIYLVQGRLVPRYKSLEFQLSGKMIQRVLVRQMQTHPDIYGGGFGKGQEQALFEEVNNETAKYEQEIKELLKIKGDLGHVAEEVFKKIPVQSKLELDIVYEDLVKLAKLSGSGSQEAKVVALLKLLQKLDPVSTRFVIKVVAGKMRLGFSTMTLMDALSWSKFGDKRDNKLLEEAYQKKADLGLLAQDYLQHNGDTRALIDRYELEVGVPVVPALCQRLNSAQEIIDKMGEVMAEPKYDGLRIQIHFKRSGLNGGLNGELNSSSNVVRAFTRNLEEMTHMFPELEEIVHELDSKSCVLDAEVVGVDKKTGKILAFQETSTRRRKHNVAAKAAEIPVKFFVFDVLEIDGKTLIDEPLKQRKDLLKNILSKAETFIEAPYIMTDSAEELKTYHETQLKEGLEGAVIKKIDSKYRSGRKGWRWVKIKEEEGARGKLNDTLDCVVMGYYYGKGKRASLGLGAFLVGVMASENGQDSSGKDSSEGKILTVAKIGTGLTDEQFHEFKRRAKDYETTTQPKQYELDKNLNPDVWLEPHMVVEIAADEITKSPIHSAGKALRFPRLVRFRDDKSWEQATTQKELEGITHLII